MPEQWEETLEDLVHDEKPKKKSQIRPEVIQVDMDNDSDVFTKSQTHHTREIDDTFRSVSHSGEDKRTRAMA